MGKKKSSKAAAAKTSKSSKAAEKVSSFSGQQHNIDKEEEHEHEPQSPLQRIRALISVVIVFLFIGWCITQSKQPLPSSLSNVTSNFDINNITSSLSSSTDALQSAFDQFYNETVQPWLDLGIRSFNGTKHETEEKSRIGYQLRLQNATAKYPVVMIPGFVTSGLELWQGRPCFKKHFRQRIWGSSSMAKAFFADRQCWRQHLALDPRSGMDPENIRVRSAQGFEAADNFIATYWVWSRIIESLADVGYDGSTMTMMSYDWRLGYEYMEKRDGYFTKLKHTIEAYYITTGEKVVLISHSMGGTVSYYFLQWVTADVKNGGGGGGKNWVDKHIQSFVNIAGTLLGVPKSIPALMSGELKDTAQMFPQLGELLEQYFGRRWRRNLWTTWGSLFGMLPKGGDSIWGVGADLNDYGSNDSRVERENEATSPILQKLLQLHRHPMVVWMNGTDEICPSTSLDDNTTPTTEVPSDEGLTLADLDIPPSKVWSMRETTEYLLRKNEEEGGSSASIFSLDARKGYKKNDKRQHWHDPIASPLPRASSLKIYCLYGTGLPTERSYHYKVQCDKLPSAVPEKSCPIVDYVQNVNGSMPGCDSDEDIIATDDDEPLESPFMIDTAAKSESQNIHSGIQFSDGDATVPLVSLGYMCQKWNEPDNQHNPAGIKVYTREKKHAAQVLISDPGRGGPNSGEHVDILGNEGVIEDVLRIVTNHETETKVNKEVIVSNLKQIVQDIDKVGGSDSIIR